MKTSIIQIYACKEYRKETIQIDPYGNFVQTKSSAMIYTVQIQSGLRIETQTLKYTKDLLDYNPEKVVYSKHIETRLRSISGYSISYPIHLLQKETVYSHSPTDIGTGL